VPGPSPPFHSNTTAAAIICSRPLSPSASEIPCTIPQQSCRAATTVQLPPLHRLTISSPAESTPWPSSWCAQSDSRIDRQATLGGFVNKLPARRRPLTSGELWAWPSMPEAGGLDRSLRRSRAAETMEARRPSGRGRILSRFEATLPRKPHTPLPSGLSLYINFGRSSACCYEIRSSAVRRSQRWGISTSRRNYTTAEIGRIRSRTPAPRGEPGGRGPMHQPVGACARQAIAPRLEPGYWSGQGTASRSALGA